MTWLLWVSNPTIGAVYEELGWTVRHVNRRTAGGANEFAEWTGGDIRSFDIQLPQRPDWPSLRGSRSTWQDDQLRQQLCSDGEWSLHEASELLIIMLNKTGWLTIIVLNGLLTL